MLKGRKGRVKETKPRGRKIEVGKEKQSRDAYSIGCIEVRCEGSKHTFTRAFV